MHLKKIEEALRPDLKKCLVFLAIILVLMSVWLNVLINMLPVMVVGTQDFYNIFCEYKVLATKTNLSDSERKAEQQRLDKLLNSLNTKYQAFEKFDLYLRMGNVLVPSSLYSCVLDNATKNIIGDMQTSQNFIGIDYHCNPYSIFSFFRNLILVYIFSCILVWLSECDCHKKIRKR